MATTPPAGDGRPQKRPVHAAVNKVNEQGAQKAGKLAEKKDTGAAASTAPKSVAQKAAKGAAGKAVAGGGVKHSAASTAKEVTQKVADKLASNVARKTDLSTEAGQRKAENAGIAADLVSGAAGGAVTGTKGGAVGAGVGAALGAAKSIAGHTAARKKLAPPLMFIVACMLLILIGPSVLISTAVTAGLAAMSSMEQGDTAASTASIQTTVDPAGDDPRAGDKLAELASELSRKHPAIPWQVIAAALHELGDPGTPDDEIKLDWEAVSAGIENSDPQASHRNLADGALRNGNDTSQHLYIVEASSGGGSETWKHHEQTKAIMVESLEAGGASSSEATAIWENALAWSLGIIGGCDVPAGKDQDTETGTGTGGTTGTTLGALSVDQIANAKTIMGIAKGMFGDDWKEASVVALLTSMQESKLLIAANDGIVKNVSMPDGSLLANETGRTDEWPLSAYPIVAKSQKYTHQYLGSMYLTLGLFQQMANQHWSTLGPATWATDPDAAVARLMDPQFSTFAFFRGLQTKAPDWKSMDPIAAAEIVQVSGMGENTRKWKDLAEQVVQKYGADAPKLTPPGDGKKPEGEATPAGNTSTCDSGDNLAPPGGQIGEVGANGWAWPTDSRVVLQNYHLGMSVDLGSSGGGPLFASYPGVVIRAGGDGMAFGSYCPTSAWWRGENQTVMIKSIYQGKELYTSLNHVGKVSVKVGQAVKAGQQVASEGMSGCTSAPHNHYFVASGPLYNGDVEPFQYIGRP